MAIYYNSEKLPAFELFESLFNLALNCKWEGDDIISRDSRGSNREHLSLLFAWPGILMFDLVQLTGEKSFQDTHNEIVKILQNDPEYNQIRVYLDSLIKPKNIPSILRNKIRATLKKDNNANFLEVKKEIDRYLPRVLVSILMLLHPKNLGFTLDINLLVLTNSICIYNVLCCMLARCFENNDGDTFISKDEINRLYRQMGVEDKLDIFGISRIWPAMLNIFQILEHEEFINTTQEKDAHSIYSIKKAITPSAQICLRAIASENKFAYVSEYKEQLDLFKKENICGFAFNLTKNLPYSIELWQIYSEGKIPNGYLCVAESENSQQLIQNLLDGILRSARISMKAVDSIKKSWLDFINEPTEIIEENLEIFDSWIYSFIIEGYQSRDEFLKFKPLARILGDIDTELDYEIINEVREFYKKSKKFHIPSELRGKLLEAKDELEHFIKSTIKEKMHHDEKDILKHFAENSNKYNYISLLDPKDIKEIIFSTEANASRDNRRKVLPIINSKLGGKKYKDSTLTKLLGLEQGKENYLIFSE